MKLVLPTDGQTKTLFAHGVRSPPPRSLSSLVRLSARLSSFPSSQARRVTMSTGGKGRQTTTPYSHLGEEHSERLAESIERGSAEL